MTEEDPRLEVEERTDHRDDFGRRKGCTDKSCARLSDGSVPYHHGRRVRGVRLLCVPIKGPWVTQIRGFHTRRQLVFAMSFVRRSKPLGVQGLL